MVGVRLIEERVADRRVPHRPQQLASRNLMHELQRDPPVARQNCRTPIPTPAPGSDGPRSDGQRDARTLTDAARRFESLPQLACRLGVAKRQHVGVIQDLSVMH
jgi:hypothetical protein